MVKTPTLGIHLAGLNLFLEPDNTVEITVAHAAVELVKPFMREGEKPIDAVERIIIEAAERMKARRNGL